jgi:hypothetical protein
MQRAVNPQTGEVLFLVNNKWTAPEQTAKNDRGDTAYLVGNQWQIVKNAPLPEPTLSPEEQSMGAFGAPSEGGIASIVRPAATKPPSELAPGEEFGKGLGAGVISLKSMWESAGLMKDIGAMSTVQQRQDLFNKIETGQITSPDQLRGLDESSSQARAYLVSDPATREKLRERNVGEIGRRTDFVKAALTTVDQYQKEAQKYKGRTTDLTDVEGAKDFANWLSYNVGSGAVQLAPIMIAAATTGGAGVAALGIGMGTGEAIGNRLEFLEKRIKDLPPEQRAAEVIDYVKKTGDTSLAVGIVSGALDAVLGPAATLAKRGLGEVVKGETRKEALKAGVKEIPKGMGQEFITGGAQEATQLGGALAEGEIDEFLTKENAKKILNAAAAEAAGALGGGAATTGARVYGADQAIRAKEKQDAQRQELQAKMSELDDLLKTVYGQEPPATAEEAPVAPVTPPPAPAAPEAGIAGLMPQPEAAPVEQPAPAAPVAEEDQPAQDLEAMLREALGATEADINTVNMPKLPEAPVAEAPPAEQPPSTALIEATLPEAPAAKQRPSTPEIYNAIIDGWQGNAGKLPKETLNWMTENGLIKGGSTTPLGQRLMDTVKQAEEAYKNSQGVGSLEAIQRGEPMPVRKSMSMDQVDEVVDKFLEANKPKIAPKVEAKPAAPAAPTAPYTLAGEGVITSTSKPRPVPKDAYVFDGLENVKNFAEKNNLSDYMITTVGKDKFVLAEVSGKGFVSESNIDKFKAKPAAPVEPVKTKEPYNIVDKFDMGENTEYQVIQTPTGYTANLLDKDSGEYVSGSTRLFKTDVFGDQAKAKAIEFAKQEQDKANKYQEPEAPAVDMAEIAKQRGKLLLKEMREGSTPELTAEINKLSELLGEKSGFDEAREAMKKKKPVVEAPKPIVIDKDIDKKIESKLKEVQAEKEGTPMRIAREAELKALQTKKGKQTAQDDLEAALGDLSMLMTKGTRLNIMPEEEQKLMPILTKLTDAAFRLGYYKFKDAAKYVMDLIRSRLGDDVADQITLDHLQGAYIGMAGKYQDQGASSKKEVIAIESMEELDQETVVEEETEETAEEAGGMDINNPSDKFEVAQNIAQFFINNGDFRDIMQARKMISEMTGQEIRPGTRESKMADEAIEAGVVMAARDIVDAGRKDKLTSAQIFDQLVDLYDRQPNLSGRSSTSVAEQAYSTPAPLAYVASELAGINKKTAVYEPTAGNGMLLIGASENNIIANELNPDRFEMLSRILEGSEIGNENALNSNVKGADFDVVIENPPFGKAGDISDIDHAIAMHSLEGMKDDGKAVLILGGVQANTEEGRREGYRGKAKREFYYRLYNQYNVVDHFTAGGNMYAKQGTTYPVDVIVIDGVGKSKRDLPAADLPQLITSYEQLKEKLNDRMVSGTDRGTSRADSGEGGEGRVERDGVDRGAVGQGQRAGVEGGRPARGGAGVVPEDGTTTRAGREPAGGRTGAEEPRPSDVSERGTERKPVPGERKPSEPSGKRGTKGEPSGVGGVSVVSGERVQSGLKERLTEEQETEGQVAYRPTSQATAVGTLVPRAMAESIHNSIARIQDEVGNLDEYVAEQLSFEPETVREYFSAEQVDALALAIRNAEAGKGFIIGDQTGVGKGRVVAAMIKYAVLNGKTPIFVTEKPNLYADMIRDFDEIGMAGMMGLENKKTNILITDNDRTVPYTLIRKENGELVENNLNLRSISSDNKKVADMMKSMITKDSLGDYKVIFTTYTQMQTQDKKETERQRFLKHFANDGYLVLDESHNAGGAGEGRKKKGEEEGPTGKAGFVRKLVNSAFGTFFSSATYAKRPDVMDLYSSTDMSLAVDKISALADAIKAGGIPMQQTVANMLTQVGQYIRRERTFAGVSYKTEPTTVDKETAENMATSMRDILSFSREKEKVVKEIKKSLDKQGGVAKSKGEASTVQGANFGSTMHNLIGQMLLSLKAKESVDFAIQRLKENEKVVMTVSNTMGSFLKDYAIDMGIKVGDKVDLSFADLYLKYLEKQRVLTITKPNPIPGKKPIKEEYYLTDADLGETLTNRYNEIREFILGAGFGSAPMSPIDYMHSELRKVKIKGLDGKERNVQTDEITGRTITINYEGGEPTLKSRNSDIKQRRKAITGFNGGDVDVLILNQAGSTGLSLHASEKFQDQRKRHMMIIQAEANIDTHMQMLGRVHRTGQVVVPSYSQMMADIPAEMRPAAVLLKKMASLNANTTASRKSAVTAEGTVDFMNDYGGQVAQEYLFDNPDVYQAIGEVVELVEDPTEGDEADIRKLTGYIPILPIKQQEEIYKDLIERYNDLIEREDSMGSNKLEAKAMDLDAQTVSSKPITEDKGDPSIFAQPAYMEQVDVKRTVKPYSKQDVQDQVKENLDGKTASEYANDLFRGVAEKVKTYGESRIAEAEAAGADPVKITGIKVQLNSDIQKVKTILNTYRVGTPVAIKNKNGVFIYGVVADIKHKGKTKNPVAGSDWKMTLALANGDSKSLPLTFSQIGSSYMLSEQTEIQYLNPETLKNELIPLMDLFDRGATVRREKRWMVTGNILAGFAAVDNIGQIISYTKNDGTTGRGVLMPRTFDFEKSQKNAPIKLKTVSNVMQFFDEFGTGSMVTTSDAVLRIRNDGYDRYKFVTSSAKREGGTYFLDKNLTAITGDFYKSGSIMSSLVYDKKQAEKAIEYILKDRQDTLVAATNKEEAREMFAPKDIPLANIKFDNERMSMNPAMNAAIDREALIREYQKVRQKSAAISAKFAKGEAGLDEQKALTFLKEAATDLKDNIKYTKPEGRLPKNFFAKATEDWNKDLISDDVYDVIRTLYEKYPEVLEGMKFSVKKQPEASDAAGEFFPMPRIVRLYKGTTGVENPETIRHEIVHSLEQMMDSPAARALVDDWSDKLGKAIKTEKSAAGQRYFRAVLDFHNNPSQETYQAALNALPSYQYYQYMNPSEYWAVNAEKLMARKLGTGWDKFVLAVKRLFEGLKFMFGFNNQYIVQRTFNDIMNAREVRFTTRALNDYVTQEAIPLANMVKNYKGGAGALAAWDSAEDTELARLQYRIVDKQVDTRMVVKAITEQIGDIRDQFDPSLQETLYHGAKASKIEKFLDTDLRPLIKKMAAMGVNYRDFEHYLHMRHAKIRNDVVAKRNPAMPDGGSGIFNEEVDDYFASLTSAEEAKYKELAETVDKMVEETQDLLIQYGLEKPETIAGWRESLPFYVPLKRDPDELDYVSPGSGLGQGFGTRGSFSKSATGSYKTVVDVLANIALQRESAIIRGEKAKVGRALYALAIQNPNPNFWKPVNPDAIRNKKKLKEEMAGFNLTVAEADALFAEPPSPRIDPATGLVEYKVNTALRNSSNVFPVRINGEDRFIFFNPGEPRAKRMAEALKNMDATQLEGYLGTMAEATRFIAAMNTQYNPVFGAWNFVRDVFAGTINLASTEIKNRKWQVMRDATPALRAIFTDLRGMNESVAGVVKDPEQKKWIALWEQFQEIGGQTGYSEQFSRSKDKASIVQREMAKMDRGNVRKKVDAMMDWLSDYNDAMENAVRVSAFKAAMDEGMTPQRAAALAKNLTVNFNRKGQATANANALYAFFNARVQGTTRMMEVLVQNKDGKFSVTSVGKKIIAGGMLLGSMQALVLMAAGFDGDEPPDFLKDKNFILPTFGLTGEKKYIIVPMPLGWNLFPNIGRELTEYALINSGNMKGRRDITDTISNIAAQVADMFNPLGAGGLGNMVMPTIIDPLFNAFVTNKDAFGRPISRQSRETTPTPGWERSRDNATALSKALAYGLNYITGGGKDGIGKISPTADQLDYIAKEYAGGVGREITKVVRYIGNKIEGEETPSYSVPIAGKLYGGLDQPSAVADKFYKNVKAMAEHEGAIKRIKERKGDVNDYRKENKEASARLINRANYVENEVAKINREIRALNKKEAPEKDIKFKKEKRDALMKAYNEEVRRAQ